MPELNEIFSKVTEALGAADKGYKILSAKVASQIREIESQKKEIENLKAMKDCSGNFKALVDKLASDGVVDECNAVYFKDNVTDKNVNEFLVKLASAVSPRPFPASPYEMSSIPVNDPTKEEQNKELEACNQKLRALYGK